MARRPSLRLRVALAFAGLGAALSLLFALGIWYAAHDVSQRLMDETLEAELADYMARRARNPHSLPPATASLNGYLIHDGAPASADLPSGIAQLPPGKHEAVLNATPYRIVIASQGIDRIVLLFNETRQIRREQRFLVYLIVGATLMTLLASVGGWWLASRVIAPVTELARAVGRAGPEEALPMVRATPGATGDEIDELARAFNGYLSRIAAFVERERAFAADASHELRTPLAVIRGAAEVLADDPQLSTTQIQRVARIERAAGEMAELIAALLLLARETNEPFDESCNAGQLAADCIERYRALAASRNTTLTLETAAGVKLPAPSALFAIVIANLIHNAVANTRDGSIAVILDAQSLVVRDSGSGISSEALNHVFKRYYRGPESSGAGIGLSLVKRICDRLDWQITLESDPVQGTSATLAF